MPGVRIGTGAIVATGSVVAIVGGNPALRIRYRFDEFAVKALMEIASCDWDAGQDHPQCPGDLLTGCSVAARCPIDLALLRLHGTRGGAPPGPRDEHGRPSAISGRQLPVAGSWQREMVRDLLRRVPSREPSVVEEEVVGERESAAGVQLVPFLYVEQMSA